MKTTRFIALALALITASSLFACSSDSDKDDKNTDTTTTTTSAATTTILPLEVPDLEDPTAPITDTDTIYYLFDAGYDMASFVTDLAVSGMTIWDDGAVENFFDGNYDTSKLGGVDIVFPVDVTWRTSIPTAVKAYILYSGNDSSEFTGRAPISWTFYGSNDGENWNVLDEVTESGIGDVDATPYGYLVDSPATYTYYKFSITSTNGPVADGGTEVQLNEMVLIGDIFEE